MARVSICCSECGDSSVYYYDRTSQENAADHAYGDAIADGYWWYDGKWYCNDCYQELLRAEEFGDEREV